MQAFKYEDRFLINPGSATGAINGLSENAKPSFVLMDIDDTKVPPLLTQLFARLTCHVTLKSGCMHACVRRLLCTSMSS